MTMKTYSPGYGAADECLTCGEHLSDPHAIGCPAAAADLLREQAQASDRAHQAILEAGGYAACDPSPGQVSRKFLAAAQRLAAELVENDQAGLINLDQWESGAEFVSYLTGEADLLT